MVSCNRYHMCNDPKKLPEITNHRPKTLIQIVIRILYAKIDG